MQCTYTLTYYIFSVNCYIYIIFAFSYKLFHNIALAMLYCFAVPRRH